ncbi:MAG: hypothetical protein HYV32_05690 [Candidatus Kerfeldbacteria bacterium]|nr:hypothetical protein [Candidatus Kerfeldbacteria bacterium]
MGIGEIRRRVEKKAETLYPEMTPKDAALVFGAELSAEELTLVNDYIRDSRALLVVGHVRGQRIEHRSPLRKSLALWTMSNDNIPFHDVTHLAVQRGIHGYAFAPAFQRGVAPQKREHLSTSEKLIAEYAHPTVLLDELFAGLFGGASVCEGRSIFLTCMSRVKVVELIANFKKGLYEQTTVPEEDVARERAITYFEHHYDEGSFSRVMSLYIDVIRVFVLTTAINEIPTKTIDRHKLETVASAIQIEFREIQRHPDQRFVDIAQRIFNQYPKNKKALFHEFLRLIGQGDV